jgi:hypothetical protein
VSDQTDPQSTDEPPPLLVPDWPGNDGTDFAHPAWWRGNDAAVASLCYIITRILDGEAVSGVCAEPWESTRRRLAGLAKETARG